MPDNTPEPMTPYEWGRRDAIRDVLVYLLWRQQAYYESEPEQPFIESCLKAIENLTAVAPDGNGNVHAY